MQVLPEPFSSSNGVDIVFILRKNSGQRDGEKSSTNVVEDLTISEGG